jgi:putative sigma-54 modulation protein
MITAPVPDTSAKLILRGIHLHLHAPTKALIKTKAERLFRHEPRIDRVRIDVERDVRGRSHVFIAKGRVELAGPDLTASVTTDTADASINLLIDKLDRMLRKRTSSLIRRRTSDDIRAHVALSASE